jgi:hypothetical protein
MRISRNYKGHTIEMNLDSNGVGNGIIVVTPKGRRVSCMRRGTHIVLSKLPEDVRQRAEFLAGW